MVDPVSKELIALTRRVSPHIDRCELTHQDRQTIDLERAHAQHAAYRSALARLGCRVIELPEAPELADGVFVEDTAVVLDEVAVLTRPGVASRRPELASVEPALRDFRTLARIEAPATLDGGDVLRVGRSIYVGRSTRTDARGVEQLRSIVEPFGYEVTAVDVGEFLHLKSAVTPAGANAVLLNPAWVDPSVFARHDVIAIDPQEPWAANVVVVGETLVCSSSFPRTVQILRDRGMALEVVDSDELSKAEAALTCCSLVFSAR